MTAISFPPKNFANPLKSAFFVITLAYMTLPSVALAVPQVVVNDPTTGQPLATQPSSQANLQNPAFSQSTTASTATSATVPTSSPMANPHQPSLAQMNMPNDSQLSQANTKLLTTNAELQRQVDSLTTQVNVLINERSGQLFMFGAFTAFGSVVAGLALGWLMFGRNKGRW